MWERVVNDIGEGGQELNLKERQWERTPLKEAGLSWKKKQPSSWLSSLHCQEQIALCKAIASGWFTHSPVSHLPFSMACMSCTILSSTDYISILKQETTYSSVTLALTYKIMYQNITLLIMRSRNLTWWAVASRYSCAPLIWGLATILVITFNHTTAIFSNC